MTNESKRVTFRDATPKDLEHVAKHLRPADRDELAALRVNGWSNLEMIRKSFEWSPYARAAIAPDGKPVAVIGLALPPFAPGITTPWMASTDRSAAFAHAFVTQGRRILAEMFQVSPRLCGYVDSRNTASIRWLRYLGFTVEQASPLGQTGIPFHHFHLSHTDMPTRHFH